MSFIQVPLGKSLTKFPNIKLSKPQEGFPKIPERATSDKAFLVNLAKTGRMVYFLNEGAGNDLITITPPTGTTFFFLASVITNQQAAASSVVSLINDGFVRERVVLQADERYQFKLPIDRLIGDGMKNFRLRNEDGSNVGSIWGWFENTEEQTPVPASQTTD